MILQEIQAALKAPKNQYNKFGGYKYRSCEDILEAVKPLLTQKGCALTLTDEVLPVGGRVYVKATATLKTPEGDVSVCAYAREAEERKGMDPAQVTGAASSYARKYALNGLFAIDDADSKDPDTQEPDKKEPETPAKTRKIWSDHVIRINMAQTEEELVKTCAEIKRELGKDYPLYEADCVAHYRRRSEEIKQELAQ